MERNVVRKFKVTLKDHDWVKNCVDVKNITSSNKLDLDKAFIG